MPFAGMTGNQRKTDDISTQIELFLNSFSTKLGTATFCGGGLKGSRPLATQIWPKMAKPIVIYNGKSMEIHQNFGSSPK